MTSNYGYIKDFFSSEFPRLLHYNFYKNTCWLVTEVKVTISGLKIKKICNTIVLLSCLCHQNCKRIVLLWHSRHLFKRELPDLGDNKDAHLQEYVNESVQAHLLPHYGVFLQCTTLNFSFNILADQPRGKSFKIAVPSQPCWSGGQLYFLLPNQQFTTQDIKIWPVSAHFTGDQKKIYSRGIVNKLMSQDNFYTGQFSQQLH